MKIAYLLEQDVDIIHPPFNGPANHVREVIRELESEGHSVLVLARLKGQLWKITGLQDMQPVIVNWIDRGPVKWFERVVRRVQHDLHLPYLAFFESLRFAAACVQELKGFGLLYERFTWIGYGGAIASQWLRTPLILEDNGDHLTDLEAKNLAPHGLQRRLSLAVMKWAAHKAIHTISSGEGWRKLYIRRWGIQPEKSSVVENGTALVDILPRSSLKSFRESSEPHSPPTLVYVGGFYPWHGIPILLEALAKVTKTKIPLHVQLIGAGEGEQQAKQLATDLQLGDMVTFTGHLPPDQFAPILAEADIGVSPYCDWPEYSGLKIFDYKAAGLATIASGEEGMPVTVQHGQTGWIVPPCDPDALAEAIQHLASHWDVRQQIGQAARLEAEQIHTWSHTSSRIEQIIREFTHAK